jgi:HNH endonuclease
MTQREFGELRVRFAFCCGYCQTREADVGSLLTVDHFEPQARGGADDSGNWVYCCFACNSFKGVFWGENDTALLHPLHDDFRLHLREENGVLRGLTARGRHHIERLHLNRPPLIAQRREKLMVQKLQDRLKRAIERYEAAEARIHRAELEREELNRA